MLISLLLLLAGLGLLAYGADRFVEGAAALGRLALSPLVIGLTVVSTATSAPELIVSAIASWQGRPSVAVGNALGSNIANMTLVLGTSALVVPLVIESRTLLREYLIMLAACLGCAALMLDGALGRGDGTVLCLALVGSLGLITLLALRSARTDPLQQEWSGAEALPDLSIPMALLWLAAGLVLLLLGAELTVRGAVGIATRLGMNDLLIGLTVVAVGTSLPELAASVAGALKGRVGLAIGNVIGSNMFNILGVVGLAALIEPIAVEAAVLRRDFPVMLGITLAVGALVFLYTRHRLSRAEGTLLLSCFALYQGYLFSGVVA